MISPEEVLGSLMGPPRNQFAEFFQPKHAAERQAFVSELQSSIHISNEETKYQLKYGSAFGQLLEPRDQVLEHTFDFEEKYASEEFKYDKLDFTKSRLYEAILKKIKTFLVEAVSNVTSAAFKFMCRGELESKEAKEYAAKNIMLNVRSIFRHTIQALEASPFKDKVDI
jgi:hypothetical protein